MPLYEYKCGKCDQVFEVRQSFSDAPLTVHENCGGAVQRILSAPALQFKGSGWYITDYARGGGRKESSSGESKTGGKTESKSDSSSGTSGSSSTTSSSTDKK